MAASFLKRNKKRIYRLIIIALLLLPLWMYFTWFFTPRKILAIAIIDKTVLTTKGQEHVSFNWVLNQEKYVKSNNEPYRIDKDYFGFFPREEQKFRIKGLERFSETQLNQLSQDVSAAYFTDAYGIYKNEWYNRGDDKERSGIVYGGMSPQDLYFLKKMKDRHKLIITEYNCLGSPTDPHIRIEFEKTFGVHWSGWIGRYFDSFDPKVNRELPKWLVHSYKQQHDGQWPFTKSGIAFVHSGGKIVVLENGTHLNKELPYIYSSAEGVEHYGMAEKIKYSFWFDIIKTDSSFNHVISRFEIDANKKGREELQRAGIPTIFPAITVHINKDYRFFYFSADFCDNPITITSSYFKGIRYFKWFMYNKRDPQERKSFFWSVYRPLITTILKDYYAFGMIR